MIPSKVILNKLSMYFKELDKGCYLIVIGMLYITIFFASFVMGYKTVDLNGRILCASVFVFPLLFPINDSLTEIFGEKTSYLMIIATIICEFLFSYITYFLASLPSPALWKNQEIYPVLTSGFLHIAVADSISLAIGFFANTYVLARWGVKIFGKGFFIRSLGATAVGELLFTISTNLITFHYFSVANIWETSNIIISDYVLKMIYSLIICIPNAFVVYKVKKIINANCTNKETAYNVMNINQLRTKYRT
ncbi:VUT family protein [Legionella pneumophila]|uniref:VUT family protein n=2 Tax=Legionella pneumophila TaxID=446 RepID=UPI0005A8AB38|nr:VUT family protein [Legionella pneumophila]HAT8826507.1 hypothetical protein [Legionella pneumophila subsp. pneumophila]AOU50724.1 hypothetical protein A9E85_15460 [Legionella pneumophila]AOU62526.1 hypothetical protein A9E89_15040 [Legionella pneumophila]AOU71516.1 hypothetical protein A9E92_15240 [Legionella pneumophila]MCW8390920.1 VUT family protein [Legionella pneumophila]